MVPSALPVYPETESLSVATDGPHHEIDNEILSLIDKLACERENEANGIPGSSAIVDQCVEQYAKLCKQRRKFYR